MDKGLNWIFRGPWFFVGSSAIFSKVIFSQKTVPLTKNIDVLMQPIAQGPSPIEMPSDKLKRKLGDSRNSGEGRHESLYKRSKR